VVAGGTVEIRQGATVGRDLSGAAGSVVVAGTVNGDILAAAGELTIEGSVGGAVDANLGRLRIGSGAVVEGTCSTRPSGSRRLPRARSSAETVDWHARRVRVHHTLVRMGRRWWPGDPKTAKSRRSIEVTAATLELLRSHWARQAERLLASGHRLTDDDFVFCDAAGEPL